MKNESKPEIIIALIKKSHIILVDSYMLTYEQSLLIEKLKILFQMMNNLNNKCTYKNIFKDKNQYHILEEMNLYFKDKNMHEHSTIIQNYIATNCDN